MGKDLEFKITGRQVGNTSASLEWALVAEGILEIGTGDGVPSALAQVELVASFRTKIILSSGGGNKTSAAIADGKNATTTTPSALGAADAANAISRHTTRKTKPSMLGADAKKNASDTGLKYFDVNATTTFQAGYDPITDGPIFGITATFNFTYPAVAPVEIDAHAYVHNLGGSKGLSIESVDVHVVLFVNAAPDDVQLTFKATVNGVEVSGMKLGTVDISANAYNVPANDTLPALGAGSAGGGAANAKKSPAWYWKGVIEAHAEVSLANLGAMEASADMQMLFNTLTNELVVNVKAKFHFENDFVLIDLEGET